MQNGGKLDYQLTQGADKISLSWGELYWSNPLGSIVYGKNVSYTVVATKDKRARLDT